MLSRTDYEEVLQMRRELAALRFAYKVWVRDHVRKANFNPDQLRDDYGRWTDEGDGQQQPSRDGRFDVAARTSRQREAECEAQYKLDSALCRMVQTPLCWEQAMRRRAACISGYALPPLNF